MAERRQIGSLAQAGPIEQLSQRAVVDGRAHGVNPSGRSEKVECHCFSFLTHHRNPSGNNLVLCLHVERKRFQGENK